MISAPALALLDAVEREEMRSLAWGFTGGSIDEDALDEMADDFAPEGTDPVALSEELTAAHLLFETTSPGGGSAYRSRFAEYIRMAVTNRQIFHKQSWRVAPSLVSDFRVDRRARRFPAPDWPTEVIEREIGPLIKASAMRAAAWQAVAGSVDFPFSGFQRRAFERLLSKEALGGTIITAGTGSGKTLAFYLPALMRVAEHVDAKAWMKVMSIYPRNELLKDQLDEVLGRVQKLDAAMRANGRRPITVGALFKATPKYIHEKSIGYEWRAQGGGFVCPYLRCPVCKGSLLWRDEDIARKIEALHCTKPTCEGKIGPEHIVLTRERMTKKPPDLLFTTTEMLNRRMADPAYYPLLGLYQAKRHKPLFALCDEVHTSEGMAGAQVALTLRRWRHAVGAQVSWVGLSATLIDAPRFFADLTGLSVERISEITPEDAELQSEGAAYQVLLRSDPATRTGVLSTSIQTAMLTARVLEHPDCRDDAHPFGSRLFAFTDDLDVVNRLYHNLMDAEGQGGGSRVPLAALRASNGADTAKAIAGQVWRISEKIGHTLTRGLRLARVSSQDTGLGGEPQAVVATSALEVGYNDPHVGAVLQHKAPMSMASYQQRKGRAGRRRTMRPLSVTVLGSFGQDAAAFGSPEHLFDPVLQARRLPTSNRYILRTQAVFALFDWLALHTREVKKDWLWSPLAKPEDRGDGPPSEIIKRVLQILRHMITGENNGDARAAFRTHLVAALDIKPADADVLLWDGPRAVLLEAVPTLYRRLHTNWQCAFPGEGRALDFHVANTPLPDFVPSALFNDLSLPEVRVIVPGIGSRKDDEEAMPIGMALRHLVPGRVTRRFAWRKEGINHWMPLDPAQPQQTITVADYAVATSPIGTFTPEFGNEDADGPSSMPVYRPWELALQEVPSDVARPSSNAFPQWLGSVESIGDGETLHVPVPQGNRWHGVLNGLSFYLHRFQSRIRVRRFYHCADATLINGDGEEKRIAIRFADAEGDAGIGFELEADGFVSRVDLATLDTPIARMAGSIDPFARRAYLNHLFHSDAALSAMLNRFERNWMFEASVITLATRVQADACSSGDALDALLTRPGLAPALCAALRAMFSSGMRPVATDDERVLEESDDLEVAAAQHDTSGPRTLRALETQLQDEAVTARIEALLRIGLDPDAGAIAAWLRGVVLETLGNAMLDAVMATAPAHATGDILLTDIVTDAQNGTARITISETVPGGAGVLEAFAESFTEDPLRFFMAIDAALVPSDMETVDDSLRALLSVLEKNEEVARAMASLRAADKHGERTERWQVLLRHLTGHTAIEPNHAFAVSVAARMVHDRAGEAHDALLRDLLARWSEIEKRFSFGLTARDYACVAAEDEGVRAAMQTHFGAGATSDGENTVLGLLHTLLWPRSAELRGRALERSSPYRAAEYTDAKFVRDLFEDQRMRRVDLSAEDWLTEVRRALGETGACCIVCRDADDPRAALLALTVHPVDRGALRFYAMAERIEREGDALLLIVRLREVA